MNYFKRIWLTPPIAFPLILLFHVGLLGYFVYDNIVDPVGVKLWITPAWMLLYTLCWAFVCDLKKWAALAYMGVTTINLIARMLITDGAIESDYLSDLFPADVIFTIIAMVYYKRFE